MKTERIIVRLTKAELATLNRVNGQTVSQKVRVAIQLAARTLDATDIHKGEATNTQED